MYIRLRCQQSTFGMVRSAALFHVGAVEFFNPTAFEGSRPAERARGLITRWQSLDHLGNLCTGMQFSWRVRGFGEYIGFGG